MAFIVGMSTHQMLTERFYEYCVAALLERHGAEVVGELPEDACGDAGGPIHRILQRPRR